MRACTRARFRDPAVDGSDMASFDGVVLGSFVAPVRGIRFYDFGVSGACRGESVVVSRRPDNVHDVNCW